MTSFGGNAFREVGWNPTFKVQGQVYHRIGSLLPETATDSAFLQIYFIADYNQQGDARIGIIPENDTGQHNHPRRDIIMCLQQMLHEINSYVRSFKYALENSTSDFIIVIDADKRPQGEHERRYNAPASNEISVIVSGDQHNRRDIVIESRGSGLRRISETHRSYDALQYPLLFPYGEDGYHFGILQNGSTLKTVSCGAFYAYLLMVHDGAFNHLHRSRQLFHQFIVDMAAKMESERLCYIRLNQTKFRCDSSIHFRDAL
ncbi:unnamed protein product [Acanthosepion pharaonis]|uniref:Helitron helicase-like domain-containing protein n=1 Tax=Acanthosepion pharaonis TaxID=158019 RepID=A0A812CWS1_ACAPH|nr:unnamed protein product [Sepia pharaonis]